MSNIINFPNPNRHNLDQMTGQTQAMRFRIIQALLGEQGRIPDDPAKILLLSKILDSIDKTSCMERRLHHEEESGQNHNQIAKVLTAALKALSEETVQPAEDNEALAHFQPLPGEMDNGLSPLSWETLFPPPEDWED